MPRVPLHSIFRPPVCLDCRAEVRLEISNPKPRYIAQLGSISKKSQEKSMSRPEHILSYLPSKIPSCSPSHTPFEYSIPTHPLLHTNPPPHINLPPSLLPLVPPLLHLTRGIYQAAFGGHTSHTVLAFEAGSHSRVQSRIQWCIQSCAGVKKIF